MEDSKNKKMQGSDNLLVQHNKTTIHLDLIQIAHHGKIHNKIKKMLSLDCANFDMIHLVDPLLNTFIKTD